MFLTILAALFLHTSASLLDQHKIALNPKPCAVAYTPDSVLQTPPPDSYVRYAGTRPRFSTCGGVAWLQGSRYILAVNMQTSSVQVYEFNKNSKTLVPVRGFSNRDGLTLMRPENICISKDESLIAIPNMSSGQLQIYNTAQDVFFHPTPLTTLQAYKLHGARFSPDTQFISYVGVGEQASISTSRLVKKKEQLCELFVQKIPNPLEPMRPKSIDFSSDGRFAVIAYCTELGCKKMPRSSAVLVSYHRDPETGKIDPSPISRLEGLASLETIAFYPDNSCILSTDQVNDRITAHLFDPTTGMLGESWTALQNPEAELSFCHGIAITADGKYVAVSNYGDDKVAVYEINIISFVDL
jgi:6-phosphogluconolactonase (cycloisomerase 2 family)